MSRLWREGHPITVTFNRQGLPVFFVWQEHTYAVERILQAWDIVSDWWSEEGEIEREYYAVTTTTGLLCVLFFDRMDQIWRLTRVYD